MPGGRPLRVALPVEVDLRRVDEDTLVRLFRGREADGRINAKLMYRTAWLHLADRIRAGIEPAPERNLRSMWYDLGRRLGRLTPADEERAYGAFVIALSDLVLAGHLGYALFDLTDENWELRRIGASHPHVIVFCEKAPQFRLLRRVHLALGVSIQALRGQPSVLTSSHLVAQVRKAQGRDRRPVQLVGLTDHDPWGWQIGATFQSQLEQLGLPVAHRVAVFTPELFTDAEIAENVFPITPGSRAIETLAQRWLDAGGGVAGALMGLAVEALPSERLGQVVGAETQAAIRRLGP